MARLLDEDTRRRLSIANNAIETCGSLLERTDVQRATMGLAQHALDALNLLYVPNYTNGMYVYSDSENHKDGIPFIIMDRGERVKVKNSIQHVVHPKQRESILHTVNTVENKNLINENDEFNKIIQWISESYIEMHGEVMRTPRSFHDYAAVVYKLNSLIGLEPPMKKPVTYNVETWPILFAETESIQDDEGALLFHELIHVNQALQGSVYKNNKQRKLMEVRNELEAYFGEAAAEEIYHGISADENPHNWNSLGVESVRRRINIDNDDRFHVSKALLAALKAEGRFIGYGGQ